ncbi:MAG: T9SS type A sorting domain-containing protein [Bacteroidia bacterium]
MKTKHVISSLIFALTGQCYAQLVFNSGGQIKINGGTAASEIYVVLASPPATPITTIGGGVNGIIMEGEYNITKYKLGTSTTAITVPYVSSAQESFPLTVNGITAGTGSGSIEFSTKVAATRATGFDNTAYLPSDVLNMQGGIPFVANNSAYTYDRFWIIDATGYTTKPGVNLNFTYINAEAAANGGNTITIPNLQAQEWDNAANTWNNFAPAGTNVTGASVGTVTNVVVPSNNFFRSWTLNDKTQPLPVELSSFKGECTSGEIELSWSTVTEHNSSYFTIEKSLNGIDFFVLDHVNAAFNSNQLLNYSYRDDSGNSGTVYYRLSETDVNSASETFTTISVSPCADLAKESAAVFYDGENINLNLFSLSDQLVLMNTYDVAGRLVSAEHLFSLKGHNSFKLNSVLSQGVYLFEVKTAKTVVVKKVLIEK